MPIHMNYAALNCVLLVINCFKQCVPSTIFVIEHTGSCYSDVLRDKHSCVENSMRHHCPICYEVSFDEMLLKSIEI